MVLWAHRLFLRVSGTDNWGGHYFPYPRYFRPGTYFTCHFLLCARSGTDKILEQHYFFLPACFVRSQYCRSGIVGHPKVGLYLGGNDCAGACTIGRPYWYRHGRWRFCPCRSCRCSLPAGCTPGACIFYSGIRLGKILLS